MYIVKNGQFRIDRNIYTEKLKTDFDRSLLVKCTTTTKRFSKNFSGNQGLKKDFTCKLVNIEQGCSFGSSEVIMGSSYGG